MTGIHWALQRTAGDRRGLSTYLQGCRVAGRNTDINTLQRPEIQGN